MNNGAGRGGGRQGFKGASRRSEVRQGAFTKLMRSGGVDHLAAVRGTSKLKRVSWPCSRTMTVTRSPEREERNS